MFKRTVTFIVGLFIFTACNHAQKTADADCGHCGHDKGTKDRQVSALSDAAPATHSHGGPYSYNPVKAEYDYIPNEEDIIAGHTFIMLGADKTLGHHVAFYESRHQHQVIIKMSFLDTKTKKAFDMSKLPKPTQGFISASVEAGTKFELYTIGNGTTKTFPVTFFDGIIGSPGAKKLKTNPAKLSVEKIYHFTRMYVNDTAASSQYMVFKSGNAKKPNEYVMAHVLKGLKDVNDSNYELVMLADFDGKIDIPDGSILSIDGQEDVIALIEGQEGAATVLRYGIDEKNAIPKDKVGFAVTTQIHNRAVGIDAGQADAKKKLGL